jgi:hypothetical protein
MGAIALVAATGLRVEAQVVLVTMEMKVHTVLMVERVFLYLVLITQAAVLEVLHLEV